MVVDTSAIIAILFNEPEKRLYSEAIDSASLCLISAVTRVELAFVAEGKKGEAGRRGLEEFLALSGAEVVAVTAQHAEIAIGAFRRFGKGRHRAGLNIADCFSYALAAATDNPLLFKGNDFIHTDLRPPIPAAG